MKFLVVSHVDARWIKQRPHFMSEALAARGHDVRFAYARAFNRSILGADSVTLPKFPLLLVPQRLQRPLRFVDFLVQVMWALLLRSFRPEVIVITSPRISVLGRVLRKVTGATLVYDHMDRSTAFEGAMGATLEDECQVVRSADLVLCSSGVLLRDVVAIRGSAGSLLVRNALSDPSRWIAGQRSRRTDNNELILGYCGTISAWFDWDVVAAALERNPGWRLRLWGPADVSLPRHPQVVYAGISPHGELPRILAGCDVLVMPFRVTPLIEAVDPVKAYEYIATGRGVVLSRYASSEPFARFAELFTSGDVDSFIQAVDRASRSRLASADVLAFAESNTWEARADVVLEALEAARC